MTFVQKYLAWGAGVLALLIALIVALPSGKARGFDVSGFGTLPILEGGRVKPLDSLARNSLLAIHSRQGFRHEGRLVGPDEWILDVLFRPQVADQQAIFVIDDPEVISLYRSILDEIGQVEISDRERVVIGEQFHRGVQRKLGTDFFVIGAQAATGQVGSVIQSGANSWWDYRSTQIKRDSDLWQVEKTQFTTLMTRSSTFLDSFWKLSRKNEIPDKWLLRDQDLDQLTETLEEQDPERRLRMLARSGLASGVQLSASRFNHLFRAEMGVSLRSYRVWSQVRTAMAGLATQTRLTDAALHGAFSDSAHFSRTFRQTFGMTPSSVLKPLRKVTLV